MMKYIDAAVCFGAGKAFDTVQYFNRFNPAPTFTPKWIEKNFPGRDIPSHNDEGLHNHGTSTIKHGRGSVLTVDLTNRCNMMCDPCFMDANQVGYVHELAWDDVKEIMDNAIGIKPKRQ